MKPSFNLSDIALIMLRIRPILTAGMLLQASQAPAQAAEASGFESRLRRAVVFTARPLERFTVAERMAHYRVPGASVAIIENCRVAETRGFGVLHTGGPAVTPDTLFQAASISKPVTAFAALRLVERGQLSLDEDVRPRLTSWTLPESPFLTGHPITLRRLLSHSAGLNVGGFGGYRPGDPQPNVRQILDGEPPANNDAVRVQAVPGTQWRYSGGGYVVAQLLMTDVAQRPFPDLMRELVLSPAGMNDSFYAASLPADSESRTAWGHGISGEAIAGKWHFYPELGAASLWTTSGDVARFAIAVMQADRGTAGALLHRPLASDMLTAQIAERGLGPIVQGEGRARSFSHGGTNEGFQAMMIAYPETCQGAVVMANGDNGRPLINEVLRAVADRYRWPDPWASAEAAAVALTPAMADRYVGTYQVVHRPDTQLEIVGDGNGGLGFRWIGRLTTSQREMLLAIPGGLIAPDSGLVLSAPAGGGPAPSLTYSVGAGQTRQVTRVARPEG